MDWKRMFDALGLNGARWQWRIQRWKNRLRNGWAALGDRRRQTTYAHKVCPECRALVAREEAVCPACGARAGSWSGQVAGRAARQFMPSGVLATPTLLAVNCIIAVMTMLSPGTLPWKELLNAGFIHRELLENGDGWRLLSYGFLHGNLVHILFNMYALYQLGPLIESAVGRRRFLVLYTASLAVAGLATCFLRGAEAPGSIGASGAIFGLVGFGLTFTRGIGNAVWFDRFKTMAMQSFVFCLYVEFVGKIGIDNLAHGGGFVAGAALGMAAGAEFRGRAWRGARPGLETAWSLAAALCGVAVLVSLGGMFRAFVALVEGTGL